MRKPRLILRLGNQPNWPKTIAKQGQMRNQVNCQKFRISWKMEHKWQSSRNQLSKQQTTDRTITWPLMVYSMSHRLIKVKQLKDWKTNQLKIKWENKDKRSRVLLNLMVVSQLTEIDNKLLILHLNFKWIKWTWIRSTSNKWYMERIKVLIRSLQLSKWGCKTIQTQGNNNRY